MSHQVIDDAAGIELYRIAALIQFAKAKEKGLQLVRPGAAPRLKDVKKQYNLKGKSWKAVLPELEQLKLRKSKEREAALTDTSRGCR